MATSLRIGTAGWAYPHWNGVVYPKAGVHPLRILSGQFDAVEINSSFYQPLKPEVVKVWIKQIESNPKFRFTAKMLQRFTHSRALEESEVKAFKAGILPLLQSRKLGAVL